ncbi:MAG TPA: urate hydroxylase PuuD [Thermoanaerobaculia bacterium]
MFTWPQDFATNFQFLLRWIHFLGGIMWIGLLYFFNVVNVQFQKEIDAATKLKVNPPLLSRTLWWFRWGAVVTWLSGFLYLGYFVTAGKEVPTNSGLSMLVFLIVWSGAFTILAGVYRASVSGGALKDGRLVALLVAIVVIVAAWLMATILHSWGASNRAISIMIGGGIGTIMLMNVWMIIWPLQKKIIAATRATAESATPAPADQPKWARRGFLASRSNSWLSVPMLFFMGAASHFPIFTTLNK